MWDYGVRSEIMSLRSGIMAGKSKIMGSEVGLFPTCTPSRPASGRYPGTADPPSGGAASGSRRTGSNLGGEEGGCGGRSGIMAHWNRIIGQKSGIMVEKVRLWVTGVRLWCSREREWSMSGIMG